MKKSVGLMIACIFMLIITMIPFIGMQQLAGQSGADVNVLLHQRPTGSGTKVPVPDEKLGFDSRASV